MNDKFPILHRNYAVKTDAGGNGVIDYNSVGVFPAQANLKIGYVFTNPADSNGTFGRYVHLEEWSSGKVLANGTYYVNLMLLPSPGTV